MLDCFGVCLFVLIGFDDGCFVSAVCGCVWACVVRACLMLFVSVCVCLCLLLTVLRVVCFRVFLCVGGCSSVCLFGLLWVCVGLVLVSVRLFVFVC